MKSVLRCAALLSSLLLPSAAQTQGVAPVWDTRKFLASLSAQAERLKPVLDEVKPEDWVARGAPEAYIRQWKSTRNEVDYLVRTLESLSRRPEKLTLALEALFRLQALEAFLSSLGQGIRRYQNPALADLLQSVMDQNATGGEQLRQYVVDLAATREQEYEIMDREAQRCRSVVLRQPSAPVSKSSDQKANPR